MEVEKALFSSGLFTKGCNQVTEDCGENERTSMRWGGVGGAKVPSYVVRIALAEVPSPDSSQLLRSPAPGAAGAHGSRPRYIYLAPLAI